MIAARLQLVHRLERDAIGVVDLDGDLGDEVAVDAGLEVLLRLRQVRVHGAEIGARVGEDAVQRAPVEDQISVEHQDVVVEEFARQVHRADVVGLVVHLVGDERHLQCGELGGDAAELLHVRARRDDATSVMPAAARSRSWRPKMVSPLESTAIDLWLSRVKSPMHGSPHRS